MADEVSVPLPVFVAFNEGEQGPEEAGDHETEEGPDEGAHEHHDQEGPEAHGDPDPKDIVPWLTQMGSDGLANGSAPAASV